MRQTWLGFFRLLREKREDLVMIRTLYRTDEKS